jgi:hypothetical protein
MLVAFAILGVVRASPISREFHSIITASHTSSCSDPNGCRTLWDILWSCVFTILLCTWVSVHPNIPSPHELWPKLAIRRVGLMLATLIAPELMVAWAVRQRNLAHKLAGMYKEGEAVDSRNYPPILIHYRAWLDADPWVFCTHGRFYGIQRQ